MAEASQYSARASHIIFSDRTIFMRQEKYNLDGHKKEKHQVFFGIV
jgi:hypothetical protein